MSEFTPKLAAFLAGVISTAFGAGITFAAWQGSHPTDVEIATALGCAAYPGASLKTCPAATDARRAREETLQLINDLRVMRRDLAKGFGRALAAPGKTADQRMVNREAAGREAAAMYKEAIQKGATPEDAMAWVLEANFDGNH